MKKVVSCFLSLFFALSPQGCFSRTSSYGGKNLNKVKKFGKSSDSKNSSLLKSKSKVRGRLIKNGVAIKKKNSEKPLSKMKTIMPNIPKYVVWPSAVVGTMALSKLIDVLRYRDLDSRSKQLLGELKNLKIDIPGEYEKKLKDVFTFRKSDNAKELDDEGEENKGRKNFLKFLILLLEKLVKINNFYTIGFDNTIGMAFAGNYSYFRTVFRRLKDVSLFRGANLREYKSAQRILESGKGTCWECAQTIDFVCRELGCKRHNIVVYSLFKGIYHSFNFFTYGDFSYLCDPLMGTLVEINKNDSFVSRLNLFLSLTANEFNINRKFALENWYVVDKIDGDYSGTLGMKKLANFLPKDENDEGAFFKFKKADDGKVEKIEVDVLKRFVANKEKGTSSLSGIFEKEKLNEFDLNDENKIKFDQFSSIFWG